MARKRQEDITERLTGAVYARFSSHKQKDVSIEQQIAECRQIAEANNIDIVEIYTDRAVSGKQASRLDFQRMMNDAKEKRFGVIIAWKSNRVWRNMKHALTSEEDLEKLGVKTMYAKEEYGDTAAGRFMLRTMMNMNQFYSENLAEEVLRGMRDNAQHCKVNGPIPDGYKKGEDGRYALDPPRAKVILEIFTRLGDMEKPVDIQNDFNERGIKTSWGKEWKKASFQAIVRNERYTGVYIFDGVRTEGGIPQIISKELWLKVQEVFKNKPGAQRRRRADGEYVLTGRLHCGKCGNPMIGYSGTSGGSAGKLHFYYICQKKRLEKGCEKTAVKREWIEREIAGAILNYLMQDDILAKMADAMVEYGKKYKEKSGIADCEKQLQDVRKRIDNFLDAMEQGAVTESTTKRLKELEAEQKRLSNQLLMENAKMFDVTREQILAWLCAFRNRDIENKKHQKELFDNFAPAVYIYDDYFKIQFNHTGEKEVVKVRYEVIDNIDKEGVADLSYTIPTVENKATQTNTKSSYKSQMVTHPRVERGTP